MARPITSSDVGNKAAGTARSCYVADLLEDTKFQDEEGIQDTCANIHSGEDIYIYINPCVYDAKIYT